MAQYKSYTHVLRIDKDEVQGILCGDVVVMPKLDVTNACLFMKDGTVHEQMSSKGYEHTRHG